MPVVIVVGAQWGDEGKGKVVDLLAERADVVARFGGGANAGHTTYINGVEHITHLLPSGLPRGLPCVLGDGMVIDLEQLLKEMAEFAAKGIDVSPKLIMISGEAHIILPSHKALDVARDKAKGANAIGTTGRGIGPAYEDKASRCGLRMEMMLSPLFFGRKVSELVSLHNAELEMLGCKKLDANEISDQYEKYANQLVDYIQNTSLYLCQRLEYGNTVLAEGAQGTLLDIDHGGYPFVTSSSTVAGAVSSGLGVGLNYLRTSRVVGVVKAFQTRVGGGPFPTEIHDEALVRKLRGVEGEPGAEFGRTTKRPRRVGWLDLPLLRTAARFNGFDEIILTKADALAKTDDSSLLEFVELCSAYNRGKKRLSSEAEFPIDWMSNLKDYTPYYEYLKGWRADEVCGKRHFDDLPETLRFYISRIKAITGVPVSMVSVGVGRDDIVTR